MKTAVFTLMPVTSSSGLPKPWQRFRLRIRLQDGTAELSLEEKQE